MEKVVELVWGPMASVLRHAETAWIAIPKIDQLVLADVVAFECRQ